MNGVHDMGGMHGLGPINTESDDVVFHEEWEGRTLALARVLLAGMHSTWMNSAMPWSGSSRLTI